MANELLPTNLERFLSIEICLKKKNPPEHKNSVTFITKVGTKTTPFVEITKKKLRNPEQFEDTVPNNYS